MSRDPTKIPSRSWPTVFPHQDMKDLLSNQNVSRLARSVQRLARSTGLLVTPNMNLKAIIEGAAPGTTLHLSEGRFTLIRELEISKLIYIIGTGPGTIIDGHSSLLSPSGVGAADALVRFVAGSAGSRISGIQFVMPSGTGAAQTLLVNSANSITIERCDIVGPTSYGILCNTSSGLQVTGPAQFTYTGGGGLSDVYYDDVSTNGIVCALHGSTRADLLSYKLGMTVANGCLVGVVTVRP